MSDIVGDPNRMTADCLKREGKGVLFLDNDTSFPVPVPVPVACCLLPVACCLLPVAGNTLRWLLVPSRATTSRQRRSITHSLTLSVPSLPSSSPTEP
ncbi:hypothetical protein V6N13_052565 [Hibiscus sabdariffa]|uniref:Uncharacterized protein n=1 Tax=Hibiscus sabdariffa TaxID=183260 RepID=A0ABR2Q5C7_9ROSI